MKGVKYSIKEFVKNHDVLQKVLIRSPIKRIHEMGKWCYCQHMNELAEKYFDSIGWYVHHGPFEGLKFKATNNQWGGPYCKMMGLYESELNDVWKKVMERRYGRIIDVGCADGYYAVGLAKKMGESHVFAYDIDPVERAICLEMAILNDVTERMNIHGEMSPEGLKEFQWGSERGLLVCDCEGYERELFTKENVNNLKNVDLIVEIHDRPEMRHTKGSIYEYMSELFSETHNITIIQCLETKRKIESFPFDDFHNTTQELKNWILDERRGFLCEWVFFEPKNEVNNHENDFYGKKEVCCRNASMDG